MVRNGMVQVCFLWLFFFLAGAYGQIGDLQKLSIAVNDLIPNGVDTSVSVIVSERLRSELIQQGAFRLLERAQMDMILQEQGFQQSGACNTSECQIQVGQLLGVDRIIVGTVGRIDDLWTITARILNVETGEVLFSVSDEYTGAAGGFIKDLIPRFAQKISGEYTGKSKQRSVVGGKGLLFIETNPAGASVLLDGKPVTGQTPLTIQDIPVGSHLVQVRNGSLYGSRTVEIRAGDLQKVFVEMGAETGDILVFSEPVGASVFIGGELKGTTPAKITSLVVGEHSLMLSLDGYLDKKLDAVVSVEKVTQLHSTLELASYLNIEFVPEEAIVRVDAAQVETMAGRVSNLELAQGLHVVQLTHPDYNVLMDTVTLEPRGALNRRYQMTHSKEYRAKQTRKYQWLSAVVCLAGAGFAIWEHRVFQDKNAQARENLVEYRALVGTNSDFESYKQTYSSNRDQAAQAQTLRNVGLGVAGFGALGFALTFVF
jgi:hypothetical protein